METQSKPIELSLSELKINSKSVKEQKSKSSWALPVNMEALGCNGVRTSPFKEKWTVNIPLIRAHTEPINLTKKSTVVEQKIKNYIKENGFDPEGFGTENYISGIIAIVALMLPELSIETPGMEASIWYSMGLAYMDDAMELLEVDNDNAPEKVDLQNIKSTLTKVFFNMLSGAYSSIEDIPKNLPPRVHASICSFHRALKIGMESIPGFMENINPFRISLINFLKANTCPLLSLQSANISIATYEFFRDYDSAFENNLEFAYLVAGVQPNPKMREHLLYNLMVKLMCLTSCITNDIISLGKDIAKGNEINYVLMLSQKEGISLADAVKKSINIIEDQTKDIDVLSTELLKQFNTNPEDERLMELIIKMYNGTIVYYAYTDRYGTNAAEKPIKINNGVV